MPPFANAAEARAVIAALFRRAALDPEIGARLAAPGISLRLAFRDPDFELTLRPRAGGGPPFLDVLEADGGPVEAAITFETAAAHRFFLGRANLMIAALRGQVRLTAGDLSRARRLLPVLKQAFVLYPGVLRDLGLARLEHE